MCQDLDWQSFKARISFEDNLNHLGWEIDYENIKLACETVIDVLNHRYLNRALGLENSMNKYS